MFQAPWEARIEAKLHTDNKMTLIVITQEPGLLYNLDMDGGIQSIHFGFFLFYIHPSFVEINLVSLLCGVVVRKFYLKCSLIYSYYYFTTVEIR